MIDLSALKDNLDEWQKALDKRGEKYDLKKVLEQATKFGQLVKELDDIRAQQNKASKEHNIVEGKRLKKLEMAKVKEMEAPRGNHFVGDVPNIPLWDVPEGRDEASMRILETVGKTPTIKDIKDHIELGVGLNILDIERATKTSGARFYYLKNQAVELEFALVRWVMDLLKTKGFELMIPPQMVNRMTMDAGGYLRKNEDEVYQTQDDLFLIGTSEQSILGYHSAEIIDVPKRYAAFSTCFRREAGSYGKDVKGIIRTHQFDKVEMFSFVLPKDSEAEQDFMNNIQEEILQGLEIPYRKVLLAAGDLSTPSAKTIDMESWLPSQQRYRETHSCSNCTDWQARRANIRYEKGKFVHTLNGTAIAIGRTLVALLENHQQADGSVKIPKALHAYLSFKEIR
ncbi:MAG: serine--tRNA ligase [Patescibacteria group bacterium]|nr:serine--tRNA ligase [Patescibacteria group bacterium]